jgi:hypothetical protein
VEQLRLNAEEQMAQDLLKDLLGIEIESVDEAEHHLRLNLTSGYEFTTSSPWRILHQGRLVTGSGDYSNRSEREVSLDFLRGARFRHVVLSPAWNTCLGLDNDYIFEVIPDSIQYEVWEAHLPSGHVIFIGGEPTVFPPARQAPAAPARQLSIYRMDQAAEVEKALKEIIAAIALRVMGIHSVGIAEPNATKCRCSSHGGNVAGDIAEINGVPVSLYGHQDDMSDLVRALEQSAVQQGAAEVYGPAGIFQNGSEIQIPELHAKFKNHLHIAFRADKHMGTA